MATEVTQIKQKIYEEDVETGAAASEETMTKFGGSLNLLLDKTIFPVHFDIHGPYNITGVPDAKVDKFYCVPFDAEIVGSHFYTGENPGSSGSTEIDILRKPLSGGTASIFSTRPIIPASAGAEADIIQTYLPSASTIRGATGGTDAVLSSTQLDAYDVLKFSFIDKPVGTVDKCGFVLWLRAR
ncbi:MAG TPA: hypothetical protein PK522_00770 [Nitrosomonas sp.]|nr:hypothetical protein [Nitrosomonas sp.]